MVNWLPADYPQVTPYLSVEGAAAAISFYENVFGAVVKVRMDAPGGLIGHAELGIGDAIVMVADTMPETGSTTPIALGGTPVTLMVYVEDSDAVMATALAAGATQERPVEDQFYGDRAGVFLDPFGHKWFVATHVEDIPDEEMARRAREMMGTG